LLRKRKRHICFAWTWTRDEGMRY